MIGLRVDGRPRVDDAAAFWLSRRGQVSLTAPQPCRSAGVQFAAPFPDAAGPGRNGRLRSVGVHDQLCLRRGDYRGSSILTGQPEVWTRAARLNAGGP